MVPPRRHKDIQDLVDEPRGFGDILREVVEFAKIDIEEILRVYFSCNAVFDGNGFAFPLQGSEHPVPNVQQIAEIGIHVQRIFRVVHAVMGRGQDDPVQEAEPAILQDVLADMDKGAPGAVDEHDKEQEGWVDASQDADRGPDDVGIGPFEKKMGICDGEVHGLRGMMGGMQTPEDAHFVGEEVIDKVGEFPNDIAVDEPIPREGGVQDRVFFEIRDTKGDGGDGYEPSDDPVCDEDEERRPIVFDPELLIHERAHYLNE